MRLAKKSILYFVSDIGVSLIGFLATLYFARVLGAEPLGKYFVAIALLGWVTIPTNGISVAINKRVSEGRDANDVFSAGLVISAFYGGIVASLAILGGQYVNTYIGADVSVYLAGLILVNILFTSAIGGLTGRKKIVQAGFLRTFERLIRSAGQIALIYIGYKVVGLLAGHIVALVLSFAVSIILFGFSPRLPGKETFRSIISYGRYSWLGNMKGKTFSWMDTLVLSLFVTSGLIGVYEVSWRLASVLVLVSTAVQQTIFPEISDVATNGNNEEIHKLLNEALLFAGIFVIPGFFGVLVLGPKILRIYGAEFVKGAPILLILILARAVNVYEMQLINVINGINRPDVAFRINLVFIVSNISLNLGLIYMFGWYGAAVATLVSSVVILILGYKSLHSLIGKPSLPIFDILKQIVAGGGMAVVLVGVKSAFPVRNMYVTVGLVFFGAFVYTVILIKISEPVRSKTLSIIRSTLK